MLVLPVLLGQGARTGCGLSSTSFGSYPVTIGDRVAVIACAETDRSLDGHRPLRETHISGNLLAMTELPSAAEVRRSLVDDLHHEDDQGLWEVVWSLNSACPDASQGRKIALAKQVVFGLLSDGLIELRRAVWPSRDGPLLSDVEIARLHHDDVPWFDPANSADLLVQVSERNA